MDDSVWDHPGAVVDLGWDGWGWSKTFIGRKRVVGVDPFAQAMEGAELFVGVISSHDGTAKIVYKGDASSLNVMEPMTADVEWLTWKSFSYIYRLDSVAVLKVNIEGSEYPLFASMDEEDLGRVAQIAVSFHDFLHPACRQATEAMLSYLRDCGYLIAQTHRDYRWFLCVRPQ